MRLHPFQKFLRDRISGPVSDDAVDAAPRTESRLSFSGRSTVDPVLDLAGPEGRAAVEATAELAFSDLGAVHARVGVGRPDVLGKGRYPPLMIVLPAHLRSWSPPTAPPPATPDAARTARTRARSGGGRSP